MDIATLTREHLLDALANTSLDNDALRPYQGRGMRDECAGLSYEHDADVRDFVRALVDILIEEDVLEDDQDERDEAIDELLDMARHDQLGRRGIAYWPSIKMPYLGDDDDLFDDED